MSMLDLTRQVDQAPPAVRQNPYPIVSRWFHWTTAVFVCVMILCGVTMKQIGDGPIADALFTTHKMLGVGIIALVSMRLAFRLAMMLTGRWRRRTRGQPIHALLYAMLLLVPVLGWAGVSDFGARAVYLGLELPEIWPQGLGYSDLLFAAHGYGAFALMALVILHIGVALGDYVHRNKRGGGRALDQASP